MKKLRGLEIYDDVRMFHKNEFSDFYDSLEKRLNLSEVTEPDKETIMKCYLKKIEDNLYKIESILCDEGYC